MEENGQWLVDHRIEMDRAEAEWLDRLAEFDLFGLWSLDGQLSCTNWLVWRTNMARSTAFEKLRVAHELRRRPVVAEAFRAGHLSYSAVRTITRIERPDVGVDEALVDLARSGRASIVDLERVARSYRLYADQDRLLPEDSDRSRDVKVIRSDDGTGQLIVSLSDVEIEECSATLQAFLDLRFRPRAPRQSPSECGTCPVDESSAEDESSAGDSEAGEAPMEEANRSAMKANAFMDLVRAALAGADDGRAAGDDRYLVHIVRRPDQPGLATLDGRAVHPVDAAVVDCDSSTVTHTVSETGEPLQLGRRTRQWSTAQRRAISVRDGGHCRFVGCHNTFYDIHHMRTWEDGGGTDIANATCQCRRHHRMLHSGYYIEGDPNDELRFYRPGGSYVGSTFPRQARQPALSATLR